MLFSNATCFFFEFTTRFFFSFRLSSAASCSRRAFSAWAFLVYRLVDCSLCLFPQLHVSLVRSFTLSLFCGLTFSFLLRLALADSSASRRACSSASRCACSPLQGVQPLADRVSQRCVSCDFDLYRFAFSTGTRNVKGAAVLRCSVNLSGPEFF